MPSGGKKTLTHEERQALTYKPLPVVTYCLSQKRYGGVYVNDNFGEEDTRLGEKTRLVRGARKAGRMYDLDGLECWEDYLGAK